MAMVPKKYIYITALAVVIFIFYRGTLMGFFQQDEWFTFGTIISGDLTPKSTFLNFFTPEVKHFNPLTDLLNILQFKIFGLKYEYWALVAIFLHIVTTFLIFRLAQEIFRKTNLAFVAALFFALLAGPSQGTTWVVAATATQGATIFAILSLILVLNSRFTLSLVSLFISLLFKETTFATFLLLPLMVKMFSIGAPKQRRVWVGAVLGLTLFYILLRALPFLGGAPALPEDGKTSFLNLLTLPVGSLAQSVVPVEMLVTSAERISRLLPLILRGEKRLVLALSTFVFIVLALTATVVYRRLKDENLKKGLVFGFLFVVINSFIIFLSPERSGVMSIIDSRNLYYISVGTSLVLASLIGYLLQRKTLIAVSVLIGILAMNLSFVNSRIKSSVEVGKMRRGILEEITSRYPHLPPKVVFYTESDTSYYGLPDTEKILPFQTGFGYTLLVWYDAGEDFPKEFFEKSFLWDITSQGYREVGDRSFGYFRDPTKIPQGIDVLTYSWEDR